MVRTMLETHPRDLSAVRDQERTAFLATLRAVGPDAPSLCPAWSAAHVAAHLVTSEAALGLPLVVVYRLRRILPVPVTRRGMTSLQSVGDRQIARALGRGWSHLLERLAAGPPAPHRLASIAPIRFVEEWIHHEDVRRVEGAGPRPASSDIDEALWQSGLVLTRFLEFLPGRDGVELVLPDGRTHHLGATTRVRLEGRPGELLLYLAGRTEVADVSVDGDAAVVRDLVAGLAI
jgi:uncharacterized protein (TIGR03085 family)